MDLEQKEKLAAAKKKLRKFQQKAARLQSKSSENGSEVLSQGSDMHQQTIDILVEEKTELMKSRDKQNSAIQQQQDEITVLRSQLHSANSESNAAQKKLRQLEKTLTAHQLEHERQTKESAGQQEQLHAASRQVSMLRSELSTVTNERNELLSRLSQSTKQSTIPVNEMTNVPNPFKRNSDDTTALEKEVVKLQSELENTRGSLAAKEMQMDGLSGKLSLMQVQFDGAKKEFEKKMEEKEQIMMNLRKEMEQLQAEHSDANKQTPFFEPITSNIDNGERELEVIALSKKVDALQDENRSLTEDKLKFEKSLEEQIIQVLNLQSQLDKYKETHVDSSTLLTQINNDKATISRAMGQNKQLKEHLVELQDKLMTTSETNASLANEVQTLSAELALVRSQRDEAVSSSEKVVFQQEATNGIMNGPSEDSILGESRHQTIAKLEEKVKELTEKVGVLQQEKAILGLSAAQVDSVKTQNIELQEKISSLSRQITTGKTAREEELEVELDKLERQYSSAVVEERIQKMQIAEREEREKQRQFLDRYYEENLKEQVGLLEERVVAQTKQFKQYIDELQVTHDDEVEALRMQLKDLQQHFRTSLQTQYNQLVQYFTTKETADIKSREEELHGHYMEEVSRLYQEMTNQLRKETDHLRGRKRTQSDEISIHLDNEDEDREWETEKRQLQATLDELENQIIKIECGDDEEEEADEENADNDGTLKHLQEGTQTVIERKLNARVRVLELQLAREREVKNEEYKKYEHELYRQSLIIQKLHAYLSTGLDVNDNSAALVSLDVEDEDGLSLTSAGQFNQPPGDMTSTRDDDTRSGVKPHAAAADTTPRDDDNHVTSHEQSCDNNNASLNGGLHSSYTTQEMEFDTKIKYLLSRIPEGGIYVQHMQKLQEKFAKIMKDNASLQERLKDIEHQNLLLEGETDTIGEYISLYQNQRRALRLQFQEKDNFIEKLLTERSDMQTHILRLQQLITELPCVEEEEGREDAMSLKQHRYRSNSISSTLSNTSVLSTTKNEMLNIIEKLKTNRNARPVVVGGPIYAGSRGPIKDL